MLTMTGLLTMLVLGVPWAALATPGLRLVVVDPGHGGANQGALARATGGWEKDNTLAISKLLAANLRAAGVKVLLTREVDLDLSLADRVKFANANRADVFVSVHLNSTERPGPVGHETFFLALEASDESSARLARYENEAGGGETLAGLPLRSDSVAGILMDLSQTSAHQDSQTLAASIQKHMRTRSPFPDRGVLQAPFIVLMGPTMPAVVVEAGFLNHPQEGKFVTSADGQARIARALADGILDFGRLVLSARASSAGDVGNAGSDSLDKHPDSAFEATLPTLPNLGGPN